MKEEMVKVNKYSTEYIIVDDEVSFIKQCIHCGGKTAFTISQDQYEAWITNNGYAQDVFPELTNEEREVLISGTHPDCWNQMFSAMHEQNTNEGE